MKPSARSKTRQLQAQLLDFLETIPPLLVNKPEPWDINGPQHLLKEGYRIRYLPAQVMSSFEQFADYTFEKVKLVNYQQPAVKLSFYDKHKYWLTKSAQISYLERTSEINRYIALLINQRDKLSLRQLDLISSVGEQRVRQQLVDLATELNQWILIRDNPEAYELVISTYYSEYRYWYVSWKFHTDEISFSNGTSHLLSPIRDRSGQITDTKLNIIFIDTQAILLTHDHQHKQIANYLAGFSIRSHDLKGQLFARLIKTDSSTAPN